MSHAKNSAVENGKRINVSVQEEYARAEALFSSIGTGAIATDGRGRIYKVNKAALDILGFDEDELLGEWFSTAIGATDIDGNDIEPLERPIVRSFLSGKSISEKMYYKTKSGSKVPVLVTVSPIQIDEQPVGAIEVFRDITLEYEIDKMKSEFISIASHQLRTPLSAINTYANMLYSGFTGDLNDDQKAHMTIILNSVDRMNGLISALLDISQLEAGRLTVNMQTVDLEELLGDIVQEQSEPAKAKKQELALCKKSKSDLCVESDPLLLGEIYNNLISNAIKYTPEQGKIRVNLDSVQDQIVFSVEDTGYGIPEELQPHIFTKFYRADNIKKIDTTGTGLGLYMVKHISDVLKGRIWFESKENKGSTFYFALPKP